MIENTTQIVSLLTALIIAFTMLIGATSALLLAVSKLRKQLLELSKRSEQRDDATDKDLEAVTSSMLRRGRLEATKKGLIKETSNTSVISTEEPMFKIRPDVVEAYRPILPTLQRIKEINPGVSRAKFAILVEQMLGEWLSKHICKVYGINDHACWDLAAELVLGSDPAASAV